MQDKEEQEVDGWSYNKYKEYCQDCKRKLMVKEIEINSLCSSFMRHRSKLSSQITKEQANWIISETNLEFEQIQNLWTEACEIFEDFEGTNEIVPFNFSLSAEQALSVGIEWPEDPHLMKPFEEAQGLLEDLKNQFSDNSTQ